MPKLGPYSRPDAFRNLDGRTWEAKLLAATRACVSAWKKDPSGGVIGVQKGPLL